MMCTHYLIVVERHQKLLFTYRFQISILTQEKKKRRRRNESFEMLFLLIQPNFNLKSNTQ